MPPSARPASPDESPRPDPSLPEPEPTTAAEVRALSPAPGPDWPSVAPLGDQEMTVEETADGSERITWTPPDDDAEHLALIAAPAGGTLEPRADGSVVVRGPDGAAVSAIAPLTTGAYAVRAPDLLALTDTAMGLTDLKAGSGPAGITLWIGRTALSSATWGEREGGRSLAVVPTEWARAAGEAGQVLLWAQVVEQVPEADSNTMRDQLTCHLLGALDKTAWNIEPWRPDVGLLATLAAECNPV
jgi:hypothetical protein